MRQGVPHNWKSTYVRLVIGAATLLLCRIAGAQDLAPRAYVITPIHSNAVVLSYSFFTGNLDLGTGLPITDAKATANVPSLSIFHSMRFFGRTVHLYGRPSLRGRQFQWQGVRAPKPTYTARVCLILFTASRSIFMADPRWTAPVHEMAAEDHRGRKPSSVRADRPVRLDQAH